MKPRLTADARDDLAPIKSYDAGRDAALGDRIMVHVTKVIRTLSEWPNLGHAGHRTGTRGLLVRKRPLATAAYPG